jgi:hypothetical protein
MKWPRISIAALMGGILFIAIGFAALKHPTPLGTSALATLLQGSFAIAILGAVIRRGPRRAFWAGFAICGGSYALLAFDLSPAPSIQRPELVTVDLLVLLKGYMTGEPRSWDKALNEMTTARNADWNLFAQAGHSLLAMMIAVLGGHLGRVFADESP